MKNCDFSFNCNMIMNIFDYIDKGLIVIDKNKKIVLFNNWVKIYINQSIKENDNIIDIMPDHLKDLVNDKINLISKGDLKEIFLSYFMFEDNLFLINNNEKIYLNILIFYREEENKILLIFENITHQINKILRYETQRELVKKQKKEIIERLKFRDIVNKIIEHSTELEEDEDKFINEILKFFIEDLNANTTIYFKIDNNKNEIILKQQINLDEKFIKELKKLKISNELVFYETIMKKKVTIFKIDDDFRKKYRYGKFFTSKILVAVPIIPNSVVEGVLIITFSDSIKIDDNLYEFYSTLAKYISTEYKKILMRKNIVELNQKLKEMNKNLHKELKEKIEIIHNQFKALAKKENLSMLGLIAGNFTHEINTPVTYIRTNAEMFPIYLDKLKQAFKDKNEEMFNKYIDEIKEMSVEIIKGTNKISEIRNHIRNFIKDNPSIENINTENLISDILSMTRKKWSKSMNVHVSIDENLPKLKKVRVYLEEILINLLMNAIDANKEIGKSDIWISAKKKGNFIIISVKDEGIGIKESDINKIFDPMFTTKGEKGTGLGLFIVKDLVNRMKGDIEVKSEFMKGTEVTIKIPIKNGGGNG